MRNIHKLYVWDTIHFYCGSLSVIYTIVHINLVNIIPEINTQLLYRTILLK